jgi:hypothetical protein
MLMRMIVPMVVIVVMAGNVEDVLAFIMST